MEIIVTVIDKKSNHTKEEKTGMWVSGCWKRER